jgi:hypothetical protein
VRGVKKGKYIYVLSEEEEKKSKATIKDAFA